MLELGSPRVPHVSPLRRGFRPKPWVAASLAAAITLPTLLAHAQQPAQPMPIAPRYVVVLDPAHGGPETGARLRGRPGNQPNDLLLEKDLLLTLSVRLRSVLTAHGIAVVTTRETDTNPLPDTRAAIANRAHASACLLLHATTSGTGVHLYTSALAPAPAPSGPRTPPGALRPWATAQAPYLTQSLKLSSDISEALTHAAIPVILGSISLAPVDNLACPAVILELAPLLPRRGKPAAGLTDPSYQTRLIDALAGTLEQWRADRQPEP